MDFDTLTTIVSKRKLPPPAAGESSKKKRRRITPTPVTETLAPTAMIDYYEQQAAEVKAMEKSPTTLYDTSIAPLEPTPSPVPPTSLAMYNTSIGFLEASHIAKQRFPLSETLYVLVGLDTNLHFSPSIYFVDKRWWLHLQVNKESIGALMCYKQTIDSFFDSPTVNSFQPLYTGTFIVTSNMPKNIVPDVSITLAKQTSIPEELDWERTDWGFLDPTPSPTVTLNRSEWNALSKHAESIAEYRRICEKCRLPAAALLERYVKFFRAKYHQLAAAAAAAATQLPQEMSRARDDIRHALSADVRTSHWTRLPNPVYTFNARGMREYDDTLDTPFTPWLDADLRAHCSSHIAEEVVGKLVQDFPWMK